MRYDMSFTHVNFTQNKYFPAASSKWTSSSCYKEIILIPFSSFWLLVRDVILPRASASPEKKTTAHSATKAERTSRRPISLATIVADDVSVWKVLPSYTPRDYTSLDRKQYRTKLCVENAGNSWCEAGEIIIEYRALEMGGGGSTSIFPHQF